MAQSNESPTHIPPFARQLAPYVKPRQEALRIRQALTSYLRSFIVFADHTDPASYNQSHLALCVPTATEVKRIPADLPGLRKEYLKALQANVAARKDYCAVSEDVVALRRQRASHSRHVEAVDPQEPGDLQDYLQLLRDQRRHTKLQVFQCYLEEWRAKETDRSADIDTGEDSRQQQQQQLLLQTEGSDAHASSRNGADTNLEDLVHKLERAVVRARTRLDQERRLFEKVKMQHASSNEASSDEVTLKVRALQQTRDELVQWVEERLVTEGDPDESLIQDLPPEDIEEAQRLLEHQKAQISEQYEIYLQARRELLDAASRACQPVTVTAPSKLPTRPSYNTELLSENLLGPDPADVLSYATETLLPLSKSQKGLALQKSYLTGLLAKEKSTTLRMLHRLSDESHLLPEYPILARQPRFQHAVAALPPRHSPQSTDQPDEVVDLAEAWAFASNAAAANEQDFVQQKVMLGTEVAQDTRKLLCEVYGTLNQDMGAASGDSEASDIWASEARLTRKVGMDSSSRSRLEQRPKGPWAGLNGRVGVE
ncbi:hypothetical protein F1880_003290 [Penicillium rolfsii]|nr:hypothetical protein F1880_003290 [Penicillium rolfsii]